MLDQDLSCPQPHPAARLEKNRRPFTVHGFTRVAYIVNGSFKRK